MYLSLVCPLSRTLSGSVFFFFFFFFKARSGVTNGDGGDDDDRWMLARGDETKLAEKAAPERRSGWILWKVLVGPFEMSGSQDESLVGFRCATSKSIIVVSPRWHGTLP